MTYSQFQPKHFCLSFGIIKEKHIWGYCNVIFSACGLQRLLKRVSGLTSLDFFPSPCTLDVGDVVPHYLYSASTKILVLHHSFNTLFIEREYLRCVEMVSACMFHLCLMVSFTFHVLLSTMVLCTVEIVRASNYFMHLSFFHFSFQM